MSYIIYPATQRRCDMFDLKMIYADGFFLLSVIFYYFFLLCVEGNLELPLLVLTEKKDVLRISDCPTILIYIASKH